ncbi:MAG: hemerythrin domain-containing protein [Betaproteobacteria bacterium]|nr:hemerythrin domain-containing protein [Betaproteobacteria bacterium]
MSLPEFPVGFDQPILVLAACHRSIEEHIKALNRLQKSLVRRGLGEEVRAAVRGIIKFFLEVVPIHHADEELELFPRMLRAAEAMSDRASAFDLSSHLMVEHRDIEEVWERVHQNLLDLLSGEANDLDMPLCREFSRRYCDHIRREEELLFPLAARLLSDSDWRSLGTAMALRRGLPAPSFPHAA